MVQWRLPSSTIVSPQTAAISSSRVTRRPGWRTRESSVSNARLVNATGRPSTWRLCSDASSSKGPKRYRSDIYNSLSDRRAPVPRPGARQASTPFLRRGGNRAAELREDRLPGAVDVEELRRTPPEDAGQGRRLAAEFMEEDRRAAVSGNDPGEDPVLAQHRDVGGKAVGRDVGVGAGLDQRPEGAARGAPDLEDEGAHARVAEQGVGDGHARLGRVDQEGPHAHAPEEREGDLPARGERGGVVGGERRVREAADPARRARAAGEERGIDGLDSDLAAPVGRALREVRPVHDAARRRAVRSGDEAFDKSPQGVGA